MRWSRSVSVSSIAVCLVVFLPGHGLAFEYEYQSFSSSEVINLDEAVPASWYEYFSVVWGSLAMPTEGGALNSIQCLLTAKEKGKVQRGLTASMGGGIYTVDGIMLSELSDKTRPFGPAARFSWTFPDFTSTEDTVVIGLDGSLNGQQLVDFLKVDCRAQNRLPCQRNNRTLCSLGNKRFQVRVEYGAGNWGKVTSWNTRGGMFSLTGSGVSQVGVEMLNRCSTNDHYWIVIATTTSKAFDIIVEDTQSGVTRSFPNPLLVPPKAAAVVDPSAFATCP